MQVASSTISTDTESLRHPAMKKLDLSSTRDIARPPDCHTARTVSDPPTARELASGPSTPLFVPSPRSLRSSHAKHAMLHKSLTKEIIQALYNQETNVSSIAERYSPYLTSLDFKHVTLLDYVVRSFDNQLLLEALVEYDGQVVRVLAEGHDVAHQFADALCEELLGCATSARIEQLLQFSNCKGNKYTCLILMTTKSLAMMGCETETVALASSDDSALAAALKAVCAGLSKVKRRQGNLEISSSAAISPLKSVKNKSSCFCLPRKFLN